MSAQLVSKNDVLRAEPEVFKDRFLKYVEEIYTSDINLASKDFSLPKISRQLGYDPDAVKHSEDPLNKSILLDAFSSFHSTYKEFRSFVPASKRLGFLPRFILENHDNFKKVASSSSCESVDQRNAYFMAIPFTSFKLNAEQFVALCNLSDENSRKEARATFLKGEILDIQGSLSHPLNSSQKAILGLYEHLLNNSSSTTSLPEGLDKIKEELENSSNSTRAIQEIAPLLGNIIDGNFTLSQAEINQLEKLSSSLPKAKYETDLLDDRSFEKTLLDLTKILLLEIRLEKDVENNIKKFTGEIAKKGSTLTYKLNQAFGKSLDLIVRDLQEAIITMRDDKFHFDDKRAWEGIHYPKTEGSPHIEPQPSNRFLSEFKTSFSEIVIDFFKVGVFFREYLKF